MSTDTPLKEGKVEEQIKSDGQNNNRVRTPSADAEETTGKPNRIRLNIKKLPSKEHGKNEVSIGDIDSTTKNSIKRRRKWARKRSGTEDHIALSAPEISRVTSSNKQTKNDDDIGTSSSAGKIEPENSNNPLEDDTSTVATKRRKLKLQAPPPDEKETAVKISPDSSTSPVDEPESRAWKTDPKEEVEEPKSSKPIGRRQKKIQAKRILSHFEIMKKCLNKQVLYNSLKCGPSEYECPICHVRKKYANYMLFHTRCHSDLTLIFEKYQNYGGIIQEDSAGETLTAAEGDSSNQKLDARNPDPSTKPPSKDFYPAYQAKNKVATKQNGDGSQVTKPRQISAFHKQTTEEKPPVNSEMTKLQCRSEPVNDLDSQKSSDLEEMQQPSEEKPMTSQKLILRAKTEGIGKLIQKQWTAIPKGNSVAPPSKRTAKSQRSVFPTRLLDPKLVSMLRKELREKVTPENPHTCKFCMKVFHKGNGIFFHYLKHRSVSELPSSPLQDTPALEENLVTETEATAKDSEEADQCHLQTLTSNVNTLLQKLVRDDDLLKLLGWPQRDVHELLVDIMERCHLTPVSLESNGLPVLQCVRKNVRELLQFCIKDQAMVKYGWNSKLVDVVVAEIVAGENGTCMVNGSSEA